ncbi:hypothetical protein D1007_12947 [Hordeum vulgare]|nr:hypothetical protein D1007_12947 [Hordeum vulgare]
MHPPPFRSCDDSHLMVAGGTVHWYVRLRHHHDLRIIALHVDTGAVRMIELPWDIIDGVAPTTTRMAPLLAVLGDGQLSVVVLEAQMISRCGRCRRRGCGAGGG